MNINFKIQYFIKIHLNIKYLITSIYFYLQNIHFNKLIIKLFVKFKTFHTKFFNFY